MHQPWHNTNRGLCVHNELDLLCWWVRARPLRVLSWVALRLRWVCAAVAGALAALAGTLAYLLLLSLHLVVGVVTTGGTAGTAVYRCVQLYTGVYSSTQVCTVVHRCVQM